MNRFLFVCLSILRQKEIIDNDKVAASISQCYHATYHSTDSFSVFDFPLTNKSVDNDTLYILQ